MAMNLFTEVYEKAVDLLKTKGLADDWATIEADLKALFAAAGPEVSKAKVLSDLREKLRKAAKDGKNSSAAVAEAILDAAKAPAAGFQERAALLKLAKHFFFVEKRGNQKLWAVSHPTAYGQWVFDVLSGKSKAEAKTVLQREREVFNSEHRTLFAKSLTLARKWSQNAVAKLGDPKDRTRRVIKRWFHTDDASDGDVDTSAATLLAGFKKITALCNSTEVIFSDRPVKRAAGDGATTYASVNSGDALKVIYIYELFLKTGKRNKLGHIPKLWLCAQTVIHEASHKEVDTDDHYYDTDGLKPKKSGGITPGEAIENADSWGYFAVDLAGMLTKGVRDKVLS